MLASAGLGAECVQALRASPEAGTLFTTLDRIATLTTEPVAVASDLVTAVAAGASVDGLTREARRWVHAHAEHPQDVPATGSTAGLDGQGLALAATIQDLIDQRASALTHAVLDEKPAWLDRLGPEPRDEHARAAWLAQIAGTVAHLDQQRSHELRSPSRAPSAALATVARDGVSI